jgi:hypothetical protein
MAHAVSLNGDKEYQKTTTTESNGVEFTRVKIIENPDSIQKQYDRFLNDVRMEHSIGYLSISNYGMTNKQEDFAEIMSYYSVNKNILDAELNKPIENSIFKDAIALKYKFQFMRDNLWTE